MGGIRPVRRAVASEARSLVEFGRLFKDLFIAPAVYGPRPMPAG
jgi:hypothetical protein